MFGDGHWKVADFGIARFVEEATSLRTLKGCLSPHYAAPEQWQYVRATGATDVYALGCIAYALLTGKPPFLGTVEEIQHRHLFKDPPVLQCAPKLRSLVSLMLRKLPESRPSQQRVRTVLCEFLQAPDDGGRLGFLAEAGARVAQAQSEAERRAEEERLQAKARKDLAACGGSILRGLIDRLFTRIAGEVPIAKRSKPHSEAPSITVGNAILAFPLPAGSGYRSEEFVPIPTDAFSQARWDVLAGEIVFVRQQQPQYPWSASLWYARLPGSQDYRWYEVSYFAPFRAEEVAPYALREEIRDADLAAAPVMHVYQVAFGPVAIDDENEEEFIERWAAILALAAEGRLRHPSSLPLHAQFWRQHFLT
jgi:serine/threonine-protein kinase